MASEVLKNYPGWSLTLSPLNLSCFSSRFCIISNPSYFGLFWNQCFFFFKTMCFSRISFVNTNEKNLVWWWKNIVIRTSLGLQISKILSRNMLVSFFVGTLLCICWRLVNFIEIIIFFLQNGQFCSWFKIFCVIYQQ